MFLSVVWPFSLTFAFNKYKLFLQYPSNTRIFSVSLVWNRERRTTEMSLKTSCWTCALSALKTLWGLEVQQLSSWMRQSRVHDQRIEEEPTSSYLFKVHSILRPGKHWSLKGKKKMLREFAKPRWNGLRNCWKVKKTKQFLQTVEFIRINIFKVPIKFKAILNLFFGGGV